MAKFNIVELEIKNGELIDFDKKREVEKKALKEQNAIYIYRGTKSQKVYIGQTIHFIDRHKQHYSGNEEKFNKADFNKVIVIFSQYFNRSALDDVESQLITYFSADNLKLSKKVVEFDRDEVINRTGGNSVNEYAGREKVASEVILPLWEDVLFQKGWVTTKKLDDIRTRELVKYSPIKKLTDEQGALISEIIHNPDKNYVINGDAGTGKTVLLTHLVASMLKNRKDARIGVVVQPNWEKTGASIFKIYGMNNSRLSVLTSTKLIKEREKYDVLQAIRPANVTRDMFRSLTKGYESKFLTTQFRIQAPEGKNYTSEDYINGIKYLLYKDTGLLDSKLTKYNPDFNRELFRDSNPDAYFGYVKDQPLHRLIEWLDEDRNFNPEHINRVLAGLVEEWNQSDGRNPDIKHWHEGDIHRRWNSTQDNWINSKDEDAKEQIGSVFAVQGIDLNKVGVLIGRDLQVDSDGKLFANPEYFFNRNGIFTIDEMEIKENRYEFTLFVLNIYYVLLTRGIDGIRIGFWKNDAFREYMERTLEIVT